MNRWTAVAVLAASVAILGLYFSGHERLGGAVGAVACLLAVVNTLRMPGTPLSKCLEIVGFLLWFVQLAGEALQLLPQSGLSVGMLFPAGFCLIVLGTMIAKSKKQNVQENSRQT